MRSLWKPALLLSVLSLPGLWGCSEEEKTARVEFRLTDAPGDYEEVNVDIQGVQIHSDAGEPGSPWTTVGIEQGVYNLLDFPNGLDTLLGAIELPSGRISQIRLLLGENNSIKVDGTTEALLTPSAQQSGLKINVQQELTEGITYTILLDFDAARSVVKTGAGTYLLKPVIRAITEATSGAIQGTVSIPEATPAVYALSASDTVATSFANEAGEFLLKGVPAGTYTVSFAPAEGFHINDIPNVAVTNGEVTDIGTVSVENN